MKNIDLHTHSIFSDGALSPEELIDMAIDKGLAALGLTDHDTIDGIERFLGYGKDKPIELIGGIEISSWEGTHSWHILGYGFDHQNKKLVDTVAKLQQSRRQRNLDILDKLASMGIPLSYQKIEEQTTGQMGRPHIARELVRLGLVNDFNQAFTRYLRKGASAYVQSFRIHAVDAVKLISQAGGAAVLAHPAVNDSELSQLPRLLPELKAAGLAGLESYYPTHSSRQHYRLKSFAKEYGLVNTGGSDFHEKTGSGVPLGGSRRGIRAPFSCFIELKEFLTKHKKTTD